MIDFVCAECGKSHRRPDSAAGTLVFCDCGRPNRVPWQAAAARDERREERPRRGGDPTRCLNHEGEEPAGACADCGEAFCARCVVNFQGRTLCGPCKNLLARRLQRPASLSGLAVAALLVGLLGSPFLFCTTVVPATQGAGDAARLLGAFAGLLLPGTALGLSLAALRRIERDEGVGGRALALTGAAFAVAGLSWVAGAVALMLMLTART